MDVQMPEMDGLEATRRIRARLTAQQQPYIIAMTANAMVEDRDACSAAGMEAYLSKPVRAQELKTLLGRISSSLGPSRAGEPEQELTQPTPTPSAPSPPVDEAVLAELREQINDGGGSALNDFVDTYLAEAAQSVKAFAAAVSTDDTAKILGTCHTWSTASGVLGATELARLLRQAEQASLDAPGDLRGLCTQIEDEYARVAEHLTQLKRPDPAG